ncbi:MAG: hypothetical protein QF879_08750 [Candidatus Latescibacteria bacterium]|nr:hypothetical protein [Candidatus Latescibacterota bacterium]MDP7239017.1 hypothetical protein [Candidatus Latescibacterota bacterium]
MQQKNRNGHEYIDIGDVAVRAYFGIQVGLQMNVVQRLKCCADLRIVLCQDLYVVLIDKSRQFLLEGHGIGSLCE